MKVCDKNILHSSEKKLKFVKKFLKIYDYIMYSLFKYDLHSSYATCSYQRTMKISACIHLRLLPETHCQILAYSKI